MESHEGFYEDLVLWSILSTGQARQTSTKPTIWQRFLDDLCYLCDTESGGRTVVSIAVSQRSHLQCFFISANGGLRKAAEQLCLILRELRQIKHKSDIDIERTKEKLLEIGVRRSSMKVRNYIRELRLHIRDAERLRTVRESGLALEPFRALLTLENYAELSHRAYHLRFSQAYRALKCFNLHHPNVTACRYVRHFLGRLASWAKSARFLVETASTHDLLTPRVKVRYVPCPRSAIVPGRTTLEDPLDHLTACLIRAGVRDSREKCQTIWRPILNTYIERWASIECGTIVHAELIMLDHFHRYNLPFAHRKRYIACSKPSCFCCAIYMAYHPLNPIKRPSHNNVWVKWAPPRQSHRADVGPCNVGGEIMDILGNSIKRGIKEMLAQEAFVTGPRVFDSMTDLSASLPTAANSVILYSVA